MSISDTCYFMCREGGSRELYKQVIKLLTVHQNDVTNTHLPPITFPVSSAMTECTMCDVGMLHHNPLFSYVRYHALSHAIM